MSRNPRRLGGMATFLITLLILALIGATGFVIWLCIDMVNREPDQTLSTEQSVDLPTETAIPTETTVPPTTEPEPVPEHVVSTATVGAMGDLLMHTPIFLSKYSAVCYQEDGTYDFESVFRYLKDTVSTYDYAAVNLETTLAGEAKPYSGFPMFNCPDAVVDSAVDAGFDMMLTANNHCYDTSLDGYLRTLDVCREKGMTTLGTMKSAEEPKYEIVEVNGIKIGMVCYTYETSNGSSSYPSLNGNPMYDGSYDIINTFIPSYPGPFYEEVAGYMEEMKAAGAEATMIYMHWGVEYILQPNDNQKAIAQKLCDIGFDVIVGGHPHVVQPMDLLESTVDPEHKTVCIYSLGNAVSNQRNGNVSSAPAYYTEDGALFTVTFEKYSDGTVYVAGTDVIPTWVNMHNNNGGREYNILPLIKDTEDQWQTTYEMTDAQFASSQKSYERTMGLVGEGLAECRDYLDQEKIDREQYYYDLAFYPERFETQPTEVPVETTAGEETALPAA